MAVLIQNQTALILFIRNPVLAKVKMRIARECGDEKALDIYLRLLDITRILSDSYQGPKYLFYSDFIDTRDAWQHMYYQKQLQKGTDLGIRMKNAFELVLERHPSAIIIGADCPWLESRHLDHAAACLQTRDAVLGPAADGGYYLLGLKKPIPSLFTDIDWGSRWVYSQTVDKLQNAKCTFASLEVLQDVDFIADWDRYLQWIHLAK